MTPELAYRQQFGAALVERAGDACPPGLDARAARRFRVYRNNVHGALIGALADAYPVVQRLVGEKFFAAMAREFFLAEPARGASLALYGVGFADFIEDFKPAVSVPYLAGVARVERARLESLHAADAPALAASALPADGKRLLATRFTPHPALRLAASTHPAVTIWRANQAGATAASVAAVSETALVTRPGYEVRIQPLDQADAAFTRALMRGDELQDAHTQALAVSGTFDVGAVFATLLEAGAFTDAHTK